MSRAPRVFLSHHSSQLVVAKHLKDVLAKRGIEAWLASEDVPPGQPFDIAVTEAIEQTDAIVLLFCAEADKSRHVKREISLAESQSKLILPVRLEKIAPQGLAYWLQDYQWVEWFERRDEALERLVGAIRKVAGVERPSGVRTKSPFAEAALASVSASPQEPNSNSMDRPTRGPEKSSSEWEEHPLLMTFGVISIIVGLIMWWSG